MKVTSMHVMGEMWIQFASMHEMGEMWIQFASMRGMGEMWVQFTSMREADKIHPCKSFISCALIIEFYFLCSSYFLITIIHIYGLNFM